MISYTSDILLRLWMPKEDLFGIRCKGARLSLKPIVFNLLELMIMATLQRSFSDSTIGLDAAHQVFTKL